VGHLVVLVVVVVAPLAGTSGFARASYKDRAALSTCDTGLKRGR
jgi:hypothetical protein